MELLAELEKKPIKNFNKAYKLFKNYVFGNINWGDEVLCLLTYYEIHFGCYNIVLSKEYDGGNEYIGLLLSCSNYYNQKWGFRQDYKKVNIRAYDRVLFCVIPINDYNKISSLLKSDEPSNRELGLVLIKQFFIENQIKL